MKVIMLFLTCANQKEADNIASLLLEKCLVSCVKMMPVMTKFLWQGSIDAMQEIFLIMESEENKFNEIEQEIRKVHSYKTFVLTAVNIKETSSGVIEWIQENLRSNEV